VETGRYFVRGFNLGIHSPGYAQILCRKYRDMGCNTIRYQLVSVDAEVITNRSKYVAWLDKQVTNMLTVIDASHGLGLQFLVDFHTPFGGVVQHIPGKPPVHHVFLSKEHEELWVEDVEYIGGSIEAMPGVFGFEVMNEPHCGVLRYSKFLKKHREFLANCTTKPKYISSVYGEPKLLDYLPKMGKGFMQTAHFWPAPISLIGAGGFVAKGNEARIIENGSHLVSLRHVIEKSKPRKKVLLGELGCTRGIGDALQVEYMRKALKYCLRKKIDVLVHGEAGNPAYGYEQTGVLEVVAEVFGDN
jgi:hypothetical protein